MKFNEVPRKIGINTNECYEISDEIAKETVIARLADEKASYEIGNMQNEGSYQEFSEEWQIYMLKTSAYDQSYLSFQITLIPKKQPQSIKLLVRHYDNGGVEFCPQSDNIDVLIEQRYVVRPDEEVNRVTTVSMHVRNRLAYCASSRTETDEDSQELVFMTDGNEWAELGDHPLHLLEHFIKETKMGEPELVKQIMPSRGIRKRDVFSYETAPRHYSNALFGKTCFTAPKVVINEMDWFFSEDGESRFVPIGTVGADQLDEFCRKHNLECYAAYSHAHNPNENIYEKEIRIFVGKDMSFEIATEDGSMNAVEGDYMMVLFTQGDKEQTAKLSLFTKDEDATLEFEDTEAYISSETDFNLDIDYNWQRVAIDALRPFLR